MNKKTYSQPQSAVTRVELESPICSGSATIVNKQVDQVGIESQQTNTSFDAGGQITGDNNGWSYIEYTGQ